METERNKSKGSIIVIIILTILVITLGGYIGYDKFLSDNNNTSEKSEINESNEEDGIKETDDSKESIEESDSLKTRICTGVYSGIASISQNIQTGEYKKGALTIELKVDGTYELKKENMNVETGEYTIIDNTLLLKTLPHTCPSEMDCSAYYSQYLSISEDCSNISLGYGSFFFEPDFILNKQN